jgi:hypothetical protein
MADQFQLALPVFQILGGMNDAESLRRALLTLSNQANSAVNILSATKTGIVLTTVLTGQAGAISPTAIYTAPVAGLYRATISEIVTTANAGATGSYTILLVNDNGINHSDPNSFATGMPLTTAGNETSATFNFYCAASTPVTLSTTATGTVTGGVYALRIVLECLGAA